MQIIIDIPEEAYNLITGKIDTANIDLYSTLINATAKGTLLPKGHGRLIDADDIDNHIIGHVDTRSCPTIIEADRED